MSDEYLMALDAGSGAGRCFLVSLDGKHAVSAYREWGYSQPAGAGPLAWEFDPAAFWKTLASAAREAPERASIRPSQVVAVSSTSQREGMVLLDRAGCEVYAGPNRDFRAIEEGQRIAEDHASDIYRRTGHYPNALFAPARLLWQKAHAPEVYARAACLLMINDWVLFRLSGERACEPTNASETCLYDLHTGRWALDLVGTLGLEPSLLPPILPAGSRLGAVSVEAAGETGLVAGTPVAVGGADTQCGLLGSGAIAEGDVAAVAGTTTPVQLVTAAPAIDPQERLWTGAHVVPGTFVLESNADYTGSVYQWYRDAFGAAEEASAAGGGESAYEIMNHWAEAAGPGAGGVRSFIGVSVMDAKGLFEPLNVVTGLAPWPGALPSRKLLARAILESLAYAVRANAAQIEAVSGRAPRALGVCGGLAKSRLYLEVLANVMGVPVRAPRYKEASAVGAAICAGTGVGAYGSLAEGARALGAAEEEVAPDAALSNAYGALYEEWVRTREGLLGLSGVRRS